MALRLLYLSVLRIFGWIALPYACRKLYPCSSGGMLVLGEDAAEALVSLYVQAGDLVRIGDRRGQWTERAGIRDALVRVGAQNSATGCDLGFLVRRAGADRKRQDAGSWLYNWSI